VVGCPNGVIPLSELRNSNSREEFQGNQLEGVCAFLQGPLNWIFIFQLISQVLIRNCLQATLTIVVWVFQDFPHLCWVPRSRTGLRLKPWAVLLGNLGGNFPFYPRKPPFGWKGKPLLPQVPNHYLGFTFYGWWLPFIFLRGFQGPFNKTRRKTEILSWVWNGTVLHPNLPFNFLPLDL